MEHNGLGTLPNVGLLKQKLPVVTDVTGDRDDSKRCHFDSILQNLFAPMYSGVDSLKRSVGIPLGVMSEYESWRSPSRPHHCSINTLIRLLVEMGCHYPPRL